MKYFKSYFYPFVALVMFALALSEFAGLDYSWAGWGYATCYPGCFCEVFRPGGIVQPISSWSNFFYLAAGLFILGSLSLPGAAGEGNLIRRSRGFAAGFGIAVVCIGLTSLFFHVSLTQFGRWLDYMGMYAFAAYALLYSLTRLRSGGGRAFLVAYVILLAALGALWVYLPAGRRVVLGGLILGIVLVEAYAHRVRRPFSIRTRRLIAALACFLAAYAVNMADEAGLICAPESAWQWHAVWHLLTAASTLLLYAYYRSEREPARG
jgi:hypothetical protein